MAVENRFGLWRHECVFKRQVADALPLTATVGMLRSSLLRRNCGGEVRRPLAAARLAAVFK